MSGHKRATITARTENIRQLSQTEMAIRFVEAGLSELSQRLEMAAQNERAAGIDQNEAINQELIAALSEIDGVFGRLEEDTRTVLIQQEEAFNEQLNQFSESVAETNALQIEQLSAQYQTVIDQLAENQEGSLTIIADKLEGLTQDQQTLEQNISKWIDAATTLLQSIIADPIMVRANGTDGVYYADLISQAVENQQAGYNEAALISAQSAYREISIARMHIHQLRGQFSALSRALSKQIELLDQEVELNKQVHVIDLQGIPLDMEIWVDDWVGGKLSQLQQEIHNARTYLDRPPSPAAFRKLRHVLNHAIPQWHALLSEYVYQARSEVINSQLRMNIALMVVRALTIQGYRLEASNYTDEDMRLDYRAQLTDSEGSRVLVQVEARRGQLETTELNLFTQDADKRTPHELRQRSLEIQHSLRTAGLKVGELTPVETANPLIDINRKKSRRVLMQENTAQVQDER
jgi:hypothetical protein